MFTSNVEYVYVDTKHIWESDSVIMNQKHWGPPGLNLFTLNLTWGARCYSTGSPACFTGTVCIDGADSFPNCKNQHYTQRPKLFLRMKQEPVLFLFFYIFTSLVHWKKVKINATTLAFSSFFHAIYKKKLLMKCSPRLMWNQFQQHIWICCRASNSQRLSSSSPRRTLCW